MDVRRGKQPNQHLSRARLGRLSPSGSGYPMSRQELADAASRYLAHPIDSKYIGKLERGEYHWPNQQHRAALRQALGAATDAELGFHIARGGPISSVPVPDRTESGAGCVASGDVAVVLTALRSALTRYRPIATRDCEYELRDVATMARTLHETYQRGDYGAAVRRLPDVLDCAHALLTCAKGEDRERVLRIQAVSYIAASKLAIKAGDTQLSWLAADRAATAAQVAGAASVTAVAAYQCARSLLGDPTRLADAESLAVAAAQDVAQFGHGRDADLVSARGSLLLLASLAAARRGDARAAQLHLEAACGEAAGIGDDDNRLWTAFGPTNVAIHRISVAVAVGRPDTATELGERLDVSRLPRHLMGRRAQVHIDLARAYMCRPSTDGFAVLHLLEAERLAPQTVHINASTRTMLTRLLGRERRAATPGLRALAGRAGIAA